MNNFHTHTKRCNHAVGNEEDYIKQAIRAGYKRLGFSGHMPLPIKDQEWSYRLSPYETEEHINEVLRLKEKYKEEIDILLTFEFEYFENRKEWVDYLIDKYPLDYTIAGAHFHKKVGGDNYIGNFKKDNILEKYHHAAKLILKSNKFDIFAHPDLFMDSYTSWDQDAKALVESICDLANENDVILEYNLAGMKNKRKYPNDKFWDIAIEKNNKIIIGVDAHSPDDFLLDLHQEAIDYLKSKNANLIFDLDV